MDFPADRFLQQALEKRKEQNALRKLVVNDQMVDFCSNDYLGFAHSFELKNNILSEHAALQMPTNGSTGSRLLAGNSAYVENLEKEIAKFHNAETGLIYNSGYEANVGLFSAVLQKGDYVVYDELIHASVHDGIRLASSSAYPFRHNDISHLEERLKLMQGSGTIYIAVEAIYSMDGDDAPLKEIITLCKKYNANLIVDEAHATGVTANNGKGKVQELNLEKEVFARVHTFGKAMGCHGAIVLGSDLLRNFMINFSRTFIYTTALPLNSLLAINQSYKLLQKSDKAISKLHELIGHFKKSISPGIPLIQSNSPIQCIIVNGNAEVKKIAAQLQESGFDVRPILSPTVTKGKERLRICIHAFNTPEQIEKLTDAMNSFLLK
ncbi:MAG: aminotransferase class I/II-fold pyridoxal phosphate-dependent enzyme [Bacteroidota bacterium]